MKRWLAAASVLAATTSVGMAQVPQKPGYLIIRVKVASNDATTPASGGPAGPGMPGGMGPGGPGMPGGMGPGGFGGEDDGAAPPPSTGGSGPGRPGGPGMPSGPGMPGMPGSGGTPGGTGSTPGDLSAERSIVVMVPFARLYDKKMVSGRAVNENNPMLSMVTLPADFAPPNAKEGHAAIYHDGSSIQVRREEIATLEYQLKLDYGKWAAKAERKPAAYLDFIRDALKADLLDNAIQYSDSLERTATDAKDLPADVAAYVAGYRALKAKWNDTLPENPTALTWKARFGTEASLVEESHYSMICYRNSLPTASLERKVKLLEKNFKTFYLWQLISGQVLPLPETKMLVMVAKKTADLPKLRESLDGLQMELDTIFSPSHNVLVLSPEPTDDLTKSFLSNARNEWMKDFDKDDLLRGTFPKEKKPSDVMKASTIAMVLKALELEADQSAISRGTAVQLYSTLNVLPKNVSLPKWIEYGIGSVLNHPRNPGVVNLSSNKPGVTVGLYTGAGSPNYSYLRQFQAMFANDKDHTKHKPADLLKNTLLDRYFDTAKLGVDIDAPTSVVSAPAAGGAGGGMMPGFPGGGGGGGFPGGGMPAPPGIGGAGGAGPAMPPAPPRGGGRGNDAQGPPPGGMFPGGPGGGGPGMPGMPGMPSGPGGAPGIPGGAAGGGGILDSNADRAPITKDRLEEKARMMSWALTYYLTRTQRIEKLYAFFGELNKLPRDLRVSKEAYLKLFCESFGLMNADRTAIDDKAFAEFAAGWVKSMTDLPPTWRELPLTAFQSSAPAGGGPTGPGGGPGGLGGPAGGFPGGPGGPPGMGGGGRPGG